MLRSFPQKKRFFFYLEGLRVHACSVEQSKGTLAKCSQFEGVIDRTDSKAFKKSFHKELHTEMRGFVQAHCCIAPESAFFHKVELKHTPEGISPVAYFFNQNQALNAENCFWKLLNMDGLPVNPLDSSQSAFFICGIPKKDLLEYQTTLTDVGIYPKTLELSPVNSCSGILQYLQSKPPQTTLALCWKQSVMYALFINNHQLDAFHKIPFGFTQLHERIQQNLGLESVEAAEKLLHNPAFDLTGMAEQFLQPLFKTLQYKIDYYEVDTGRSLESIEIVGLPPRFNCLNETISRALNIQIHPIDLGNWAQTLRLEWALPETSNSTVPFLNLLCLANSYSNK